MGRRSRAFLLALAITSLAVISIPVPPVQGDCWSDDFCVDCLGYNCVPRMVTAYCECESGVNPRYCVAGGGTCWFYLER